MQVPVDGGTPGGIGFMPGTACDVPPTAGRPAAGDFSSGRISAAALLSAENARRVARLVRADVL
jgi:hypothetical protein